jgi:hypothetical protein
LWILGENKIRQNNNNKTKQPTKQQNNQGYKSKRGRCREGN